MRRKPGFQSVGVWVPPNGDTVVTTGAFESEEAFRATADAARKVGATPDCISDLEIKPPNPDGDELLAVEQAAAQQSRQDREASERERRRPACRRCSARFSDERWEEKERGWNDGGLCADCRQADAGRKALEAAERERAAAETAAAEAKRLPGAWWRRS
ncbi:hypothetical protein ACWC9T_32565 [Kitasatospora sp. NPDC001159]